MLNECLKLYAGVYCSKFLLKTIQKDPHDSAALCAMMLLERPRTTTLHIRIIGLNLSVFVTEKAVYICENAANRTGDTFT